MQVDFFENATIASQHEIQAAHWNHGQATLFIAHAWINECENQSFAIISDELTHTKHSVYVFMDYILKQLTEKLPSIKKINIFSDGAGQQFKQRYLFSNLHIWEEKFDVKIIWNFFATSHGKGVVDGLGCTVKRSVWRHIRSEKAHITSAKEYSIVAKERNPSIHIQYITKEEIALQKTFLDAH